MLLIQAFKEKTIDHCISKGKTIFHTYLLIGYQAIMNRPIDLVWYLLLTLYVNLTNFIFITTVDS